MELIHSCSSVNIFRPPIFFVQEIKVIIPNNRLVKYEGSSVLNKPVNGHGLVQSQPPPTLKNFFSTSQCNVASTLFYVFKVGASSDILSSNSVCNFHNTLLQILRG